MKAIQKPKIIAIVGPTASGKTSLSIALAKKFDGEIVSADSRQIYRGMTIGTAKAPVAKKGKHLLVEGIPHHMIDVRDPDEEYTVADFKRDAMATIEDILHRGKLPFLVGGTGLYVRAVVENLDIPAVKADPALRQKLEREISAHGLEAVFKKLVDLDPEAAYIVDPKNPRRVIRALEVTLLTGKPFTASRLTQDPLFETLTLGITQPDTVLRRRIDNRIDLMMEEGLVKEVKSLVKKYGPGQVAFDAIGYREIIAALEKKISIEEAVRQMKSNTWHFAKRQMTWFRNDASIRWIKNPKAAEAEIKRFLK